ncbi:MAG: hypothetical protein JXL80_05365 [Planctomycetes bacterium]|nr:hypothetical protein [Planctomycetota bacterium]
MLRLLGKHPYLSLAVLMAVSPAVMLPLLAFVLKSNTGLGFIKWFDLAWYALCPAAVFLGCFMVSLARRRGGRRVFPLLLASPGLVLLHDELMILALACSDAYDDSGGRFFAEVFNTVRRINLQESDFQLGLILAVVGAVAGTLAGSAVAAWLIRSGRWETITPVDLRPQATSLHESGDRR